MTTLALAPAALEHVAPLAADLRAPDVAECWALGESPVVHLEAGIGRSAWSMVALTSDGAPVAIWGVWRHGHALAPVGRPWCLSTSLVPEHRGFFLRTSREMVARMRREYPVLENVVHAPYTAAVRWLRWLGFELGDPFKAGPDGEMFMKFAWKRP